VVKFLDDLFKNELKLPEVGKDGNVQFEINLRSDNGGESIAASVQLVCDKYGVKKKEGSAYSPRVQGVVERLNQTLNKMILQLLKLNQTIRWKSLVQSVLDDYCNAYHSTIGMTPADAWRTCYCTDLKALTDERVKRRGNTCLNRYLFMFQILIV
jgi:hypothetical protein